MIVLSVESDDTVVEALCRRAELPCTDRTKAYTAKDGEEVLGFSLFEVGEKLDFLTVETAPMLWNSIGDGLFRATVNYAIEHGICGARIEKPLLDRVRGNIVPEKAAAEQIENCEDFLLAIKRCGH